MRKLRLFSAVLSLFLLVPASIIWAQSVSLTGVVYQNSTVKIPLTVPEGKINVYLPDDMAAGDHITGTVVMEASGKNDKEKTKNLDLLKQYVIKIGDAVLDATTLKAGSSAGTGRFAGNFNLPDKWWGIVHNVAPVSLTLMKEPVANVQMPLVKINTSPAEFKALPGPKAEQEGIEFKPLKKVITSNESIVIQSIIDISIPIDMTEKQIFSWDINDQRVAPFCSSPRQTIIAVPPGTIGKTSITAKDKNGITVYSDEVYVVDIRASIDKQNLRNNERTDMQTQAAGINDCPYPVSMTIVNKTTETVLLDKGAHQTYFYNPGEKNNPGYAPLTIRQGVTGVMPGGFDITASLILPSFVFSDVFHQQKSALKTPEDYNAWADALKKDLKAYADKQGNDEAGKASKANAERAIDNIPKCYDKNKLDECKAFADAYLRPVNIPKGAATMWVCGFEAYKAAIKAITGTLAGKPELIDWEVIKNGLEFIRNMGEQLKDEELQSGASDAKKLVETIQKTGETKEKMQELQEKLEELNEGMQGKTSLNPSLLHAYPTEDLLRSSFISNIPSYRTMSGTDAVLNVNGQPAAGILSVDKSANGTYVMQIIPGASAGLSHWVNSFISSNPSPAELSIITPPKTAPGPGMLDFKNALIQEIEFPKMDAGGKESLELKIIFSPEQFKYSAGGGKTKASDTIQGKQWMPANFKMELGNLPCDKVTRIESFKITQKTTGDNKGIAKYIGVPGRMEYPNITFYVPETDVQPWRNWFDQYVKTDETKNGNLRIIDETGQLLYAIPLNEVKPGNIIYENLSEDKTYRIILRPGEIVKPLADVSPAQPSKGPDRMNDLIGVFNPFSKTLYYNPLYQQQVFSKIQPVKRTDGKYNASLLTANRKPARSVISIVAFSPGQLFDQSAMLEEKMNDVLCDQQDTKPQDKPDRTPAERITGTWDSTGTGYRFYKNAKCERFKEGGEVACHEQTESYPDPVSGATKTRKTGKFEKMVYSPLSHCFKGTDFCTEMYFVDLLIYIYDDANCKRLIDVKKYHAWSCE